MPRPRRHEHVAAGSSPSRSVLVVDDDAAVRTLLTTAFELAGWEVHTAEDGALAIDALLGGPTPGLVVVDLMMPGTAGFEVLQAMHASPTLSAVPRVVCSARDVGSERDLAETLGAVAWFVKPIDTEALLATAERLVGALEGDVP